MHTEEPEEPLNGASNKRVLENERSEILQQLEDWFEVPMLVLGLAWLVLLLIEFVRGLSPLLETLGTFIWVIFILDFAVKFILALDAVGDTLRWWLLGRLISMVVIGVLTAAGLYLLNVPLALTLGILAALLNFVPNVGPLLSVIPGALLALTQGPTRMLYVITLYLAVQGLENYLLTPFIQRRTLSMPPVLTLIAQVVFGALFGWLGLVLATPLAASAFVILKMLYVQGCAWGPSGRESREHLIDDCTDRLAMPSACRT